MVMQGIDVGIDGLHTAAIHEDFTSIENGILTVSPIANPSPRALNKHEIGMQGGYIDLRLFDVHPDAHEFCRYWQYLASTESRHEWPLTKIVRYLLRRQGSRVATGLFSMYPAWAKLTELIGLMYYFEGNCNHSNIYWGTELAEISKTLAGTVNGDLFPGNEGEWFQNGLPDLDRKITSYVSELRFTQEVHREGHDFRFLEEKGDVRVKTEPPLNIDITHYYPGYGLEYDLHGAQRIPKTTGLPDRVTMESVASEVRETMKPPVLNKFEKHDTDIDGIAVDTTQSLSGLKFMGVTQLGHEPPGIGEQIEWMAKANRQGEQPIMNFHVITSSNPHSIAICTTRSRIMRQYRSRVRNIIRKIYHQFDGIL